MSIIETDLIKPSDLTKSAVISTMNSPVKGKDKLSEFNSSEGVEEIDMRNLVIQDMSCTSSRS